MKNNIFIISLLIITQISYGQYGTNNLNVTIKKDPLDISRTLQAGAALRQAAAANSATYNEAIKDNYSNISYDNLINNTNNYKYVVIENISGWLPKENKEELVELLVGARKYEIIDLTPDYKPNGKKIEKIKILPIELKDNPKVLFVNWLREAQGDVIRITKLTIKNHNGNLIYESTSKNLSFQEILKPLISNYVFTKETALSKIEELKKYLDLGIITKEEYELKIIELKPILLNNN